MNINIHIQIKEINTMPYNGHGLSLTPLVQVSSLRLHPESKSVRGHGHHMGNSKCAPLLS